MTKIEGRFSRRTVLRGGAALAATAAVSPYLVFRAHAAPAKGELAMIAGTPNPKGALEKLYLLKGDPPCGTDPVDRHRNWGVGPCLRA